MLCERSLLRIRRKWVLYAVTAGCLAVVLLVVTRPRWGTITGRILLHDGTPATGFAVAARERGSGDPDELHWTRVGDTGRFSLPARAFADTDIVVMAGKQVGASELSLSKLPVVIRPLDAGGSGELGDIEIPPLLKIKVHVLENGAPVVGGWVFVWREDYSTGSPGYRTDMAGAVVIEDAPAGVPLVALLRRSKGNGMMKFRFSGDSSDETIEWTRGEPVKDRATGVLVK
jgi:hypothetical protein